ncbi:hypothetical protein Bpro_4310 [Polaromonas sp. JS666]|nr:hypothetical protein Bpro_4310 [Polaromonas sp. JS666]
MDQKLLRSKFDSRGEAIEPEVPCFMSMYFKMSGRFAAAEAISPSGSNKLAFSFDAMIESYTRLNGSRFSISLEGRSKCMQIQVAAADSAAHSRLMWPGPAVG